MQAIDTSAHTSIAATVAAAIDATSATSNKTPAPTDSVDADGDK